MASRQDLTLWSLDECHLQQQSSRCVMWILPEDKDPVLLHAPTRKSIALFGAVNLRSGKLVTMLATPFNAERLAAFLRLLAQHRDYRLRNQVILARGRHPRVLEAFRQIDRRKTPSHLTLWPTFRGCFVTLSKA